MASCLGIHISGKILKYAKITSDNNKNLSLEQCGVKFLTYNKMELIKSIVTETKSEDLPIALSTYDDYYQKIQVFRQLNKQDMRNVINLEFEDWCEKKAQEPSKYQFSYFIPDSVVGDYYNGMLNLIAKQEVEIYKEIKDINVTTIVPAPFTMKQTVPTDEKNYMLVDLDDRLYMTTVVDSKIVEFVVEEIGMKDIFSKLIDLLGSEQRAYEACKKINVFSEGESTNQKDIEEVTEPVLQEILKRIADTLMKHKSSVNKILITGMGVLFTNIDILFREYLDIKAEILKPSFVSDMGSIRNVAEALEATSAMALATQYLTQSVPNITQYKKSKANPIAGLISKFKAKKPKKEVKPKEEQNKENKASVAAINIEDGFFDKATPIAVSVSIFSALLLITYLIITNIYVSNVEKIKSDIDQKANKLISLSKVVNEDIQYINNNKSQYKTINDDIQNTVGEIEGEDISKYTTYNVSLFMQKIIKVIPKNVQLKTISSDDNKKVKIVAQSKLYSDLGYFVAQLKLQSVLNNVKINSIKNGETVEIEIGGDLP